MSRIMRQLEAEARAARERVARPVSPEMAGAPYPLMVGRAEDKMVRLRGGAYDGAHVTLEPGELHRLTMPTVIGGQDYVFSGEFTAEGFQIWEAV